ncbi:MFS transporter [Streptomyces sp. P17]|uniref:MFS transporter n=1 Tax=Streptomyces sp. P17 TaxID=3074716 RepID=UPI0028F41FE8|nr:MFS transporter [Streptomyces sp. P17]MDT9701064.1 MFS transporter [Streptomyces sp. P17]
MRRQLSSVRFKYMAGMVVDATGSGMYLPLSLLYFHHVTGLPLTEVGAIVTAASVIGLISNPVAGVLIDRFSARAVLVGGYVLRASAFCIYPFVDNGVAMFAVVLPVALGDTSYPPAIQSFVAEIVQGAERDKLLALQRSLRNAGMGVGGLLAGAALALDDSGFYVVVLGAAAGYLLAAGLMSSIRPGASAQPVGGRVSRKGGYRMVARNRPFLGLTLLNIPTAFAYMVLSVALPVYLTRELDAPVSLVGIVYAVNTVGIAALQIPVTRLLVRYRRTRAVALGAGVFGLSFVTFAVLGGASSGPALIAGVFVATAMFTAGELLHGATASALVAQAAPEQTRGRHLAVYQLSWALPIALAPTVLTALLSLSATGMWLLLAAGVAGSALGVLRLEHRLPAAAVHPVLPEAEPAVPTTGKVA